MSFENFELIDNDPIDVCIIKRVFLKTITSKVPI